MVINNSTILNAKNQKKYLKGFNSAMENFTPPKTSDLKLSNLYQLCYKEKNTLFYIYLIGIKTGEKTYYNIFTQPCKSLTH